MEELNSLSEAKEKGYAHFEDSMFPPNNPQELNLERWYVFSVYQVNWIMIEHKCTEFCLGKPECI